MKTYQEFVSEALMARPSLVPSSLNKPQPAAVQSAQKNIVRRPVPATKPVNTNTATARHDTCKTNSCCCNTSKASITDATGTRTTCHERSICKTRNTAGANQVRSTLSTGTAGASDQRAQQLNRVRNQARSATIANARSGQGMMRQSPVVQQQRPVPTARPVVQQQRPAATGTPQTKAKPDIFTDTPVGGKPYGNAATAGTGKPVPGTVQQQPKFRERDLFTDQPLNQTTGKPIQQQPKFRERDLFTDQPLNQTTGKPIQQ